MSECLLCAGKCCRAAQFCKEKTKQYYTLLQLMHYDLNNKNQDGTRDRSLELCNAASECLLSRGERTRRSALHHVSEVLVKKDGNYRIARPITYEPHRMLSQDTRGPKCESNEWSANRSVYYTSTEWGRQTLVCLHRTSVRSAVGTDILCYQACV